MAQLNLHPCAVQMTWLSEQPLGDTEWKNRLQGFLADLGRNCIANSGSLIGHIKGIATVAGKPYLQLSLVSATQAANIDGLLPEATEVLGMTLNVLVFGMSADNLATAVSETGDQATKFWRGGIEIEILPATTEYPVTLHG